MAPPQRAMSIPSCHFAFGRRHEVQEESSPVYFDSEFLACCFIPVPHKSVLTREADQVDEDLYVLPAVVGDELNLSLLPPLKRLKSVGSLTDIQRGLGE